MCLFFYILPYELRVARFNVSGCSWKFLASYVFWPLSMASVLLPVLRLCSRNDKRRFLVLKQWGGSDCWRNLSNHEFYSMGGSGEEDGHQWIKQLREERQSRVPKPQVGDLLCFGCGLYQTSWMAVARGQWHCSVWRQGWSSDADLENHLFIHRVAWSRDFQENLVGKCRGEVLRDRVCFPSSSSG